jgi:hypothetical protein
MNELARIGNDSLTPFGKLVLLLTSYGTQAECLSALNQFNETLDVFLPEPRLVDYSADNLAAD